MCPEWTLGFWSGQLDSNQRPAVPKTAALPGCAIPRSMKSRRYTLERVPARPPAPDFGGCLALSTSVAIEQRMGNAIARGNAVFLGRTADHFEHALRQAS